MPGGVEPQGVIGWPGIGHGLGCACPSCTVSTGRRYEDHSLCVGCSYCQPWQFGRCHAIGCRCDRCYPQTRPIAPPIFEPMSGPEWERKMRDLLGQVIDWNAFRGWFGGGS